MKTSAVLLTETELICAINGLCPDLSTGEAKFDNQAHIDFFKKLVVALAALYTPTVEFKHDNY